MHFYPANAFQKLDFHFILKELEHLCAGSLGNKKLLHPDFITNYDLLTSELHLVNECKELLQNDSLLPQYGFNELPFLQKLYIENYYLDVKELLELYFSLTSTAEIVRFFSSESRQQLYPNLYKKTLSIQFESSLILLLSKVIDIEKEVVKDNASIQLSKIRKQIQEKIKEINSVFRRVIQQYKVQNQLADTEETIRDGRRVLSVKSEYKRSVKGLLVDESENGRITYIEPKETVFLNNELTELYLEDRREVIKILIDVTNKIKPHKNNFDLIEAFLSDIDIIRAKAFFAINYNCAMPRLSKNHSTYLKDFVHPVLYYHHKKQNKPIVENSLLLQNDSRIIVISGPNAGGKSILLKSVGLIQMMVQFGMLIPAHKDSEISIFDNLFVDIGDEQSIENDLSTYSSHLSNMNYFLTNANSKTLVLIDEMGMGTDPALGGPMAESILEALHKKNVFGIITTHLNNLKVFAANTVEIQCGAMAFDTKQLKPLFQLQIGQPGSSFTFEIAKKSGLQDQIISNAQLKMGDNKKALDEVLSDIQTEKYFIKGLRKNVQNKESQLEDLTKNYEKLNKELEKEKKRLIKNFEARLLDKFNEESRSLENQMRNWKEEKKNKQKFLEVRNYIDENRKQIENKLNDFLQDEQENQSGDIIIGSKVKLEDGTEVGEVTAVINKTATVVFGSVQTKVKLSSLLLVTEKNKKEPTKTIQHNSRIILEKSEFDYNLDIRGLMKDEAITALDHFLDKAVMYGIHSVKIIHGKGTGALKQTVQLYLKKYPFIKKYRYENDQFGGDGITIAELK